MAGSLELRLDCPAEDRYLKVVRDSAGLEIRIRKLSDDSLLGKLVLDTGSAGALRGFLETCCKM